jgi:predicted transcriptional regulator of viral defense system
MKVRRGLWLVGTDPIDPRRLAEEITRPYPSYVSFLSALNAHDMIDQVPRHITIASLDSATRVRTPLATYAVSRQREARPDTARDLCGAPPAT